MFGYFFSFERLEIYLVAIIETCELLEIAKVIDCKDGGHLFISVTARRPLQTPIWQKEVSYCTIFGKLKSRAYSLQSLPYSTLSPNKNNDRRSYGCSKISAVWLMTNVGLNIIQETRWNIKYLCAPLLYSVVLVCIYSAKYGMVVNQLETSTIYTQQLCPWLAE